MRTASGAQYAHEINSLRNRGGVLAGNRAVAKLRPAIYRKAEVRHLSLNIIKTNIAVKGSVTISL
jgi:hypothetical protein